LPSGNRKKSFGDVKTALFWCFDIVENQYIVKNLEKKVEKRLQIEKKIVFLQSQI
jgi:hypothetical protein